MGGGGAGGGGNGSGANGKGGKEGAGDGSGGQGPEGGAQNAGSCGQGSGGGCPNPSHGGGGTQAGHPIDPITGRVYTLAVTDMALPGAFPLVIERAYSSAQREVDDGLGHGWNHSLGWRIVELRRQRVRELTDTAQACEGPRPELGETVKLPVGLLTRTPDGYLLRAADGLTRAFEDIFAMGKEFRLSGLLDRNGNQAKFYYENGSGPLQFINDSVGRLLRVRRHSDGHIAAFEVRNPSAGGAWTSFRTYEYDARGDLVAARDALGHAITFTYDEGHRMVTERWPTGLQVHYRYDRQGRCVETWCTDPNESALIADGVPAELEDGRPAKGFLHARVEYNGEENNILTSRALRSVAVNALGKADQMVWAGRVHKYEFDDAGGMIGYQDGLGRAWKMGQFGSSYRIVNPLGQATEYQYDPRGNIVTTRTPDGLEMRHSRDPHGNLLELSDTLGPVVGMRYDERGCLIFAETADGARTAMKYDALCNRVEIVEPDGGTRKLRYDFLGRLLEMQDEKGGISRWTYDAMGQVVEFWSPLGARTVRTYDEVGRFTGEIDPDGRWYRLTYAGLREVIAIDRSDGSRVTYGYDRELDLVRIVNEQGDLHSIQRDLEGRILSESTFDGRTLRYRNDPGGRLTKITFSEQEYVELEYDDLDRVISRTFSDDTFHKIEYDDRGRVSVFETEAVRSRYAYDARGRCVREETELVSDPSSTTCVEHFYDSALNRTRMRTRGFGAADAKAVGSWQTATPRDGAGRCQALLFAEPQGPDQLVASFGYAPTHGEVERRFAGTGGLRYTHDALGNVLSSAVLGQAQTLARPGEPDWVGAQQGPESLRFDYRWSPGGELQSLADRDRGAQLFFYDARGRIAEKRHDPGLEIEKYILSLRGDVSALCGRQQSHLSGGRLAMTGGALLNYDSRGRLIRKVENSAETTYEWTVAGLLSAITLPDQTRLEFVYDGFARRLEKRVFRQDALWRHRFRWDGEDLLEETVERQPYADAASPFSLVERRRYAYAPDSPVPIAQALDTPAGLGQWQYFVHRDGAPLPLALVDANGLVNHVFEAEAYGRIISGDATATLSRFPGHWFEPETGLHYNRWRYFDPTTATYLSPEPLGLEGGLESYGYVSGRPLALVDFDGLMTSTVTSRRLPQSQGGGTPVTTGQSAAQRRPGGRGPMDDLHPAVAAALPQDTGRAAPGRMLPGGINEGREPSHCSEPYAVSQYLREYEARNNVSCDPGTPEGTRHLRRALRRMGPIGSTDETNANTPCAPCPNCSQTLARLHAMAGTGQLPEMVPAAPPGQAAPVNFRPPAAGTPLARAQANAAGGNNADLDNARNANAQRYRAQLEADRAAGRNNHSDAEIQQRTNRVAGMTPGVFGGTGANNDWGPV